MNIIKFLSFFSLFLLASCDDIQPERCVTGLVGTKTTIIKEDETYHEITIGGETFENVAAWYHNKSQADADAIQKHLNGNVSVTVYETGYGENIKKIGCD